MNNALKVLCIGSASKDVFFPTDEGVILETPEDLTAQTKVAFELGGKFLAYDRYEAVGGVAANVAQGLSRLGISAGCYCKVGQDEIGRYICDELKRQSVDTTLVELDRGVKSDLSVIIVITQSGDRIIFHNRDANEKLIVVPEKIMTSEWFYVSSLNGPWEQNLDFILEARRSKNIRMALNPGQHNLKKNPKKILAALKETQLLFLNKDEALELLMVAGVSADPRELQDEAFLMKELFAQGVPLIGLTDGKRGAWAYDGKQLLHAEIYEPNGLVDTTGAGDAFGSGFFAAHLWNLPLEVCLQYGVANAGSVVGSYGAAQGLLSQEDIVKYLPQIPVHPFPSEE